MLITAIGIDWRNTTQNLLTTGTISALSGTFSGLTPTHVIFAGTGGLLTGSANLIYDSANNLFQTGRGVFSYDGFMADAAAIKAIGANPSILQHVSRTSGFIAYDMVKLKATNTTSGLSEYLGAFGVYGNLNTAPTAPSSIYVYCDANPTGGASNAILKIGPSAVSVGYATTTVGTSKFNVSGTTSLVGNTGIQGITSLLASGVDGTLADVLFIAWPSLPTSYRHKIQSSVSSTTANSKILFSLCTGAAAYADVLTLKANGFCGINNTSPTVALDVIGAGLFSTTLGVTGLTTATGGLVATAGFGCNGATIQTAYASGGAAATTAGAFGFGSDAERAALTTLVANIRLALVANGIMS